jgi:hypothetical protein
MKLCGKLVEGSTQRYAVMLSLSEKNLNNNGRFSKA